jgi:preprotein translocase subunit SecA
MHRDEIVCTALAALHLYERDRHYLIRDGKIEIVDETTGRIAQGRRWSRSLHELLEIKERCEVTDHAVTLAQITYQRFFQRYHALAGMSGTLSEARAELLSTYGLPIVRVPLARPSRRTVLPTQLYADDESLWKGVIKEALEVSRTGRPVLVGTDSVVESEALSRRFLDAGVAHAVLNARQDENEAHLVSQAGRRGQITIATNMAGRGTDIELATEIAELGGLHLICCQHNASRRIDRQLLGRCARRGDPGTARTMLALSKPLVARLLPRWVAGVLGRHTRERPDWLIRLLIRAPQLIEERRQRSQRRELLRRDRRIEQRGAGGMPLE